MVCRFGAFVALWRPVLPDTLLLKLAELQPHSRLSGLGTLGIRSQVAGPKLLHRSSTSQIALNDDSSVTA